MIEGLSYRPRCFKSSKSQERSGMRSCCKRKYRHISSKNQTSSHTIFEQRTGVLVRFLRQLALGLQSTNGRASERLKTRSCVLCRSQLAHHLQSTNGCASERLQTRSCVLCRSLTIAVRLRAKYCKNSVLLRKKGHGISRIIRQR
jgi:hypothetical protein